MENNKEPHLMKLEFYQEDEPPRLTKESLKVSLSTLLLLKHFKESAGLPSDAGVDEVLEAVAKADEFLNILEHGAGKRFAQALAQVQANIPPPAAK
jgi:hypothetical protein